MKKYNYQVLRYLPDRVSGEFVNVGIVCFGQEEKYLKAITLTKLGRIKHLFPNMNTRALSRKLKTISDIINKKGLDWNNDLELYQLENIKSVTSSILPEDDSALTFSKVQTGIDLSIDNAIEDLYNRMVTQHNFEDEKYLSDKDIWSKYYKRYFDEYNLKKNITSRILTTSGDNLKFDYAVKNGKWNYLEPVTFDLSRSTNVRDKVYKWMGKLEELETSEETFKLYLLSKLPNDRKLVRFIKDRISNTKATNFEVSIIEPSQADNFAKQLKLEIEHN